VNTLSARISQAITGYGNASVAVSLLSFEEAAGILAQARNDPVLSTVKWYGSDGIAMSEALVANSEAARFAMTVGLLCPVYGGHTGNQMAIVRQIEEKIGRQPDAFSLAAYDAARYHRNTQKRFPDSLP
jgi:branched-chain amino acid transport system substrate-binding protein